MKTPSIKTNETKTIMNRFYQYLRPDGLNSEKLIPVTQKVSGIQYFSQTQPIMSKVPEGCGQIIDFRFG